MSNNKIAVCVIGFGWGGTERRALLLFNYLKSEKSVSLVINEALFKIFKSYGFSDTGFDNLTILKHGAGRNILIYFSLFFNLRSFLLNNNFDSVISLQHAEVLFPFLPKRIKKISCITLADDNYYYKGGPITKIRHFFRLSALKSSDRVMCISSTVKSIIGKTANMEEDKLKVFPSTYCDVSSYLDTPDLDKKEEIITFLGRFVECKNPFLFIDVARELINAGKKYFFYLIGYGPLFEKLEKYIKEKNLSEFIKILETNKPEEYLKRSKIFLTLMADDNYSSQSLFEAMLSCNVVFATNVGETPRLIIDGKTGFLLEDFDAKKIAEKIIEAMSDEKRIRDVAMAARKIVLESCKIEDYWKYLIRESAMIQRL